MENNLKTFRASFYDVLTAPIVSEKSTMGSAHNTYFFKVSLDANKDLIKNAIEQLFKVTVLSVNTSVLKGKTKRFKGRLGKRATYKKAMVRLKDGDMIDFGVKVN